MDEERLARGIARLIRSVGWDEAGAFLADQGIKTTEDGDLIMDDDTKKAEKEAERLDAERERAALERRIAEKNARLDAREDPKPAEVLPPLEKEKIFDVRFVVEKITKRDAAGKKEGETLSWTFADDAGPIPDGVPTNEALGQTALMACRLIAMSPGNWSKGIFLAARGFLNTYAGSRGGQGGGKEQASEERQAEAARLAAAEQRAKESGGGSA